MLLTCLMPFCSLARNVMAEYCYFPEPNAVQHRDLMLPAPLAMNASCSLYKYSTFFMHLKSLIR